MKIFCLSYLLQIFLFLSALIFAPHHAIADAFTPKYYQAPAQDLASTLADLSQQSGMQLIYESQLVEGLRAREVQSYESLEQVLRSLLHDTDLEFIVVDKRVVVIRKKTVAPTVDLTQSQATAPDVSEENLIVTGSRIPRVQLGTLFPVQVIDQDILQSGNYTNIADALNEQPLIGDPLTALDVPNNVRDVGASFANLYGLGSQRTLTLVNGRRVVASKQPSPFGEASGLQVDLNSIPKSLIDRVEIIGVGGAPIYGADAIAGTINIILKQNVEGFAVDFQLGEGQESGGDQQNFSMLFGHSFGRGDSHITLNYEYQKQDAIFANDREYTSRNFDYFPNPEGFEPNDGVPDFIFGEDLTDILLTTEGIPAPLGQFPAVLAIPFNTFFDFEGNPLTFGRDGRLRPFEFGEVLENPGVSSGGEGFRWSDHAALRLPIERHMVTALGHIELEPFIQAFGELHYYEADVDSELNTPPINYGLLVGDRGALPVSINNPFLHPDDRLLLIANGVDPDNGEFFLNKELSDITNREADSDTELGRVLIGLQGEIVRPQAQWQWEIYYQYGRSDNTTTVTDINNARLLDALDTTLSDGNVVCSSANPGCVAYNPFGPVPEGELIEYVTGQSVVDNRLEQEIWHGHLTGAWLDLNGGPLETSIGVEYRAEKARLDPNTFIQQGLGRVAREAPLSGKFYTRELFAEFLAPVIGDTLLPGLEGVELEASWREVDHSVAGRDSTWTVGGHLSFGIPRLGILTLRGNATESIRSPSIVELFLPSTAVPIVAFDPCDNLFVNLGDNPEARRQNCIEEAEALGAPYQPDCNGTLDCFASQLLSGAFLPISGNPDLGNEHAQANSWGLLFESGEKGRFFFALDRIEIEIDDAIELAELTEIMEACYDRNDDSACALITRDPDSFQVTRFDRAFQPIGRLRLEAIQITGDYRLPTENLFMGDLSWRFSGFNTREYTQTVNNETFALDESLPYPEWKWQSILSYQRGPLGIAWSSYYTSDVKPGLEIEDKFAEDNSIEDYLLHHVHMNYRFNDMFSFRLGVRNVLDAHIPEGVASRALLGTHYDIVGRFYSAGASINF